MRKKIFFISTLLIVLFALAACGKTNDEITNEKIDTEQKESEEVENGEKPEDSVDSNEDNEKTKEPDSQENDDTESNHSESLADAELMNSDQQDYSIYVLPTFTLTSEEPGRDSLYLNEDGVFFMRIETLPVDEDNYEYLKENTITSLEASSNGKTPQQITEDDSLPKGENIVNAVGYTVDTAEGKTTGIIFEREGLLVRLTIFDTLNGDHFMDFLTMGETITKK